MTRPTRNRLLVVVLFAVALAISFVLPLTAQWAFAALAVTLTVLTMTVTSGFREARELLKQGRFDDAALKLAAFEKSLLDAPWKERLAGLSVGLYTGHALAASRNTLGAVRLSQQQLDEALAHFEAAIDLDPAYAIPWANKALVLFKRGDTAGSAAARAEAARLGYAPKTLAAQLGDKI